MKIDALGYAPNSMKIGDLMEILKGSVQRQIHEMARSVLSEFKMRQTVSVPQAFHLYPRYIYCNTLALSVALSFIKLRSSSLH